jgi:hypothetical protein
MVQKITLKKRDRLKQVVFYVCAQNNARRFYLINHA